MTQVTQMWDWFLAVVAIEDDITIKARAEEWRLAKAQIAEWRERNAEKAA